jgi:hypothetical protein
MANFQKSTTPDEQPSQTSDKYPGEAPDKLQNISDLSKQLTPKDPQALSVLGRFDDTSGLQAENGNVPQGRFATGFAKFGDLGFQIETGKLIYQKIISPGTFVISDTGHDIPVFAKVLSGDGISAQGAFRIPLNSQSNEGLRRNGNQAQTWGDEIEAKQKANADAGKLNLLFAGLDCHRDKPIDPALLPTPDELKKLGITNVVYLAEGAPSKTFSIGNVPADVANYIKGLSDAGLAITFKGIDYRADQKRNEFRSASSFR